MMEDLGFYLANHSKAQCMFWGRSQGEDFVHTRCGRRMDDLQAKYETSDATCFRSYPMSFGGTLNNKVYPGNPFIVNKCARPCCEGDGTCENNLAPGLVRPWANSPDNNNLPTCNAECWTPDSLLDLELACGSLPYGSIIASGRAKAKEIDQAFTNLIYALVAMFVMIFVIFCGFAYYLLLAENHRLLLMLEFFFCGGISFAGFCCAVVGIIMLADWDARYEALFEELDIWLFTLGSTCVLGFGFTGIVAVKLLDKGFGALLKLHLLTLILFCLVKLFIAVILIIWVMDCKLPLP